MNPPAGAAAAGRADGYWQPQPGADPVVQRRRIFALALLLSLLLHLPLLLDAGWPPPDASLVSELAVTLAPVRADPPRASLERARRQTQNTVHPVTRRSRRDHAAPPPAAEQVQPAVVPVDAAPPAGPDPASSTALADDSGRVAGAPVGAANPVDAPVPGDAPGTAAPAGAPGVPDSLAPATPPSPSLAQGAASAPAGDPLAALPSEGEVDYQVTKGSGEWRTGRGTLHWLIDHDHYRLDLSAHAEGLPGLLYWGGIHWSSEGHIAPDRLLPDYFSKGEDKGVRFDWAARTLTFLPSRFVRPLPDGCQDLLSVFFQFAVRPPSDDTLTFPVTNADKLDRYAFEMTERSRLELGIGSVATLHISRLHALQENGFEVWLAEDRNFLPVQMRLYHARLGVLNLYATAIRVTGRQGRLQEP